MSDKELFSDYLAILQEELIPAMGCTEPIAVAYAAAKARELLGTLPERLDVCVSGNILKNVKSVFVPHTNGLRGINAAAAVGAVAGDASRELEVISDVSDDQIEAVRDYLQHTPITVSAADTDQIFDILLTACAGADSASVRIAEHHTNIVLLKKNGEVLFEKPLTHAEDGLTDRSCLNIADIIRFAENVDIGAVAPLLDRQIEYNMAIAEEGLSRPYGANIGRTLFLHADNLNYRMRAYAAAASDARMNGCERPVVINSGSGNQGITASVPVIVYAADKGISHEDLLRALCVSNLVTIHLKTGIGRLSAYCGAVSAGVGAAAGVAFLRDGSYEKISHTIVNALAMDSGIVCDGAKASCAAKIASAVDAGILALEMYELGNEFVGGDGLVKKGVENTIRTIGCLAREGMAGTDKEIIRLMLEETN